MSEVSLTLFSLKVGASILAVALGFIKTSVSSFSSWSLLDAQVWQILCSLLGVESSVDLS